MAKRRDPRRRKARSNPYGTLSVNASGSGFVETGEGTFFVPASKMAGAFDGDLVEVVPVPSRSKKTGNGGADRPAGAPCARVVRVVDRANDCVIGRYEVADPFGVVVPSDSRIPYDIFTMRSDNPEVPDGAVVRVRMLEYPTRRTAATGVVEEVLSEREDRRFDIDVLVGRYRFETAFSRDCLDLAERARVDVEGALADGYRDLRGSFAFTIDPDDARDFDDAVSLQLLDGGRFRVGVHIADVSHYVVWGSPLDLAARRRATSVYLVDRVIPMLPERLSGDICSLLPGQPRRCMSVEATVAPDGSVLEARVFPSVIESKARLSYGQAQCYLEAGWKGGGWRDAAREADLQPVPAGAVPLGEDVQPKLFEALAGLDRFARLRTGRRREAGGIDFDTVEAKVVLDSENRPTDVELRCKTAATSLVEEAMLMANECVAARLSGQGAPALFRVHDRPNPDALAGVVPVLEEFGYTDGFEFEDFIAGKPEVLQNVLERAKGRPEGRLVTQLVLRCMQRAVYSPRCEGHYALASRAYCHFTSPIRRYPDLVVHRMLKASAGGARVGGEQVESLAWLAEHSSDMERIAERAARESQELKLVEYMRGSVGCRFTGVVTGVATYGLFVQLENTVEGLLPVQKLGAGCFSYDPVRRLLANPGGAQAYRLGQRIRVVVTAAPPHQRHLEFDLARDGERV